MVKIIKGKPATLGKDHNASSSMDSTRTLDMLHPGEEATISSINAETRLKMHLLELGFVNGSAITFLMTTPFGDPNIYSLRGTSIALRKSEARCIRINP